MGGGPRSRHGGRGPVLAVQRRGVHRRPVPAGVRRARGRLHRVLRPRRRLRVRVLRDRRDGRRPLPLPGQGDVDGGRGVPRPDDDVADAPPVAPSLPPRGIPRHGDNSRQQPARSAHGCSGGEEDDGGEIRGEVRANRVPRFCRWELRVLRLLLLVPPPFIGGSTGDGLDGAPAPRVVPRGAAAAEGGGVRGKGRAGVERSRRGYGQVADGLLRVVGGGIGHSVVSRQKKGREHDGAAAYHTSPDPLLCRVDACSEKRIVRRGFLGLDFVREAGQRRKNH